MKYPSFIGPSNPSLSPIADQESTMNMYLEKAQSPGAIAPLVLYSIPGFETVSTAATGFGRGHIFIGGREFVIIGTAFIEVNQFGVQTNRGTVAINGNPATICGNGDAGQELFITSGGKGYVYDLVGNTLSASIALLNPFTSVQAIATMGATIDGFFIWLDATYHIVYISALNDGTIWTASQYIQRSQAPDPWVQVGVSGKYIYFIGEQTGEAWYNAGTSPIPFVPASAGLFNYGSVAPFSGKKVGDAYCWLGQTENGTGLVMRAPGLRPEVISTDAIEHVFGGYSTLADGIGDSHSVDGHTFYTITFTAAGATWAWDETFPTWTERGFWDTTMGEYDAWRPIFHAFAFGEDRFLDLIGSKIVRMVTSLATDLDGNGIRWERIPPLIIKENKMLYFGTFEVLAQTGIGLSTGQGSDPQMMMAMSNDGRTWGAETWRSMGALGKYETRVRWNRCGSGRKKGFKVAGSDPVRVMLAGASIDPIEEGAY